MSTPASPPPALSYPLATSQATSSAKKAAGAEFGFREADARAKPFTSKYYTADIHKGAQALPPFVAEALAG